MSDLVVTPLFRSAMDAVADGQHVFITGRAGTGKSTLLSMIRGLELGRSCAVVAPTGVAALNVEGETIHSFFGFRPSLSPGLREYRAPAHLEDVDVLIVDEVSMARADLMDMMDTALRRRRNSPAPFGGVQMVLVGDLYQLPPVVTDEAAESVLHGYSSPFFFAAKAFRSLDFRTIELDHVFRQRDDRFIRLLNTIRDGTATPSDLHELNTRVDPERAERPGDGAITLATTNRAADAVNRMMLDQLDTPIFTSRALISGEFDTSLYKAELHLSFAVGAQVMMLVNSHEYVNGSLGRVVDVAEEKGSLSASIELTETGAVVEVDPHRWEITRPVRRDGHLESEVVGSFTQLPFRLAWAVTVHKSQGKTFDHLVFDRGRRVFAAGQLYVALSRCTSLEGLTLKHPLRPQDVLTDPEVKRFHIKATTKRIPQVQTLRAFVGYVGTGGGEFNKLVEIAVIRETHDGDLVVFTTLVNPLRDITDAAECGIRASDVAVAPTVAELRRPLAALLSGSILITDGIAELHRLLDWHQDGIDEGLGIDLRDHGLDLDPVATTTALDRAHEVREAAHELEGESLPVLPLTSETTVPEAGSYLLPRDPHTDLGNLVNFITTLRLPAEARLALVLGLTPGARSAADELLSQAHVLAQQEAIPDTSVKAASAKIVESLIAAANRNATFTPQEVSLIEEAADAFELPLDRSRLTAEADTVELVAGTRVCFTGSPPSGAEHTRLSKQNLRDAAAAAGLEETPSVTKTKCDLLVAFDASSMSGKAKKARELGKPIISAEEFLRLLDNP